MKCFLLIMFNISLVFNAKAKYENYAAFAVSVKDNEVLYSQNQDKIVYLASLTKLMTLYLAFEAIKDGRISLYDKVLVSQYAASQVEKKIHLIAGKKYTFKELLLAAAIFSANDASIAIAEEISGNVPDFIYLMNQKASTFGLINTHFVNPTGLTNYSGGKDQQNYSTPVDLINLARRLRTDFPEYYKMLGMELFAQNGKIYGNSNTLLKFFKGLDGSKTGYTNMSGFNLFSSFSYRDEKIMAVVFGLPNFTERQKHMQEILEYSVKKVLYRNKIKDPKTNQMIFEYDLFLKSNSQEEKDKPGLYWQIMTNIIQKNKKETLAEKLNVESLSVIDQAISEISTLSDLVSHPMPVVHD